MPMKKIMKKIIADMIMITKIQKYWFELFLNATYNWGDLPPSYSLETSEFFLLDDEKW